MTNLLSNFEYIFCFCAFGVAFAYAGYPILIWGLAHLFGRRRLTGDLDERELPTVSLLIAAHNEAAVIEDRLWNALAMDYPKAKLEVVVASDGSTDGTAQIVRQYANQGVRLLDNEQRLGKSAVLNASIPKLNGQIVLLSDANTQLEPEALRKLVRWFQQPTVGVVCGRLVLTDPRSGRNVDSLYWRYETFLKHCEAKLGALLGANGAVYAIRRDLYTPIPSDTVVDDFVIPLQAKLNTGCEILYDREAIAREETPADLGSEFRRRVRIGAGGYQSISRLWRLMDPRRGWIALAFLLHKILRWCGPFLLIGMLSTNALLLAQPFYRWTLVGQLGFYLLSIALAFTPPRNRFLKPMRLTTMFCSMNLALLFGFWAWLRGTQAGIWERTARPSAPLEPIRNELALPVK